MPKDPDRGRLDAYRAKRAADRTPEPFGGGPGPAGLFVVQHHAARRLHHDFRLEWQGVLLSWAVPRGPSLDPSVRRLAVHVEDHPVEYASFEGVIPEGNYGAGAVILWDRGRWIPREDVDEGLEKGKLLFDLEGYKLRGRYTLLRTGGRRDPGGKQWLLIKKPDAHAVRGAEADLQALPEESILSGLTLREMREGSKRAQTSRRSLSRLGAPRLPVDAAGLRPMLAERCDEAFSRKGWLFEVKYDGYRIVAETRDEGARLYTRRGRSATRTFPEISDALAALPYGRLVLDGEMVALDSDGRPRFQRLQQRAQLRRAIEIERARVTLPVTYYVFDLLAFEDRDLRGLPLRSRKKILSRLLPARGPLRYAEHWEERGEDVYTEITRLGLEGMLAKRADSPYVSQRSSAWQKIRALRTDDFVVVGFTAPRGARSGFGSLHLAAHRDGDLVYTGRVGSGFRAADLKEQAKELEQLGRDAPACAIPGSQTRGSQWVEPCRVVEVRYAEITSDGLLRQPVFLRFRDDKAPEECLHPVSTAEVAPEQEPEPESESVADRDPPKVDSPEVPFTNLDKVFWPAEGYTKGDLIEYHRRIAPWLLPYLRDRPLVLTRYPDGIEGKSFFQKDAPSWAPSWLRTETMWSEQARREIHYFVCDELEQLLYVVNLGTIPLHVWSSRLETLPTPDWCILDLDPKGAPFAHVVQVARTIRRLCEEIGLPSFVKTSGSSGLHVLLPVARRVTYEQSRTLAGVLAQAVVSELPEIATIARSLRARQGRVYVDYLQNGHGRLLAAPFCVRPLPGAPVSMPLRWREVTPRLDIGRFTLRNAAARMARLAEDPLRAVLDTEPDLLAALARLQKRGAS